METKKRMIEANALTETINTEAQKYTNNGYDEWLNGICVGIDKAIDEIEDAPTVDAVEVPCKIGDFVWAIRSFHGHKHPQRGIVSEMYFLEDMSLQIVVKYVARGKWGETVFATDNEAYAAIGERKDK